MANKQKLSREEELDAIGFWIGKYKASPDYLGNYKSKHKWTRVDSPACGVELYDWEIASERE